MLKVYQAVFKNSDVQGMYALSLVENPAMEDEWIMLKEHPKEITFAAVDEEKRLLLGAVLIPNKKIFRNIKGHEFFITFTADTIEKIGHDFMTKGNQNNSSLEHKIKLKGMSVVESWVVKDPLKDKSAVYGKSYEKGTLVQMMKVDNDEIWKKAKNGEIKGFSIDALLGLKEIKLNTDKIMTNEDFFNGFKAMFSKKEDVELTKEIADLKVELTTQKETLESDHKTKIDSMTSEKALLEQDKVALTKEVSELKVKLSKEVEGKDKEIADLKVELSKQAEADPIVSKPGVSTEVEFNKGQTTRERVFGNLTNILN